MPLPDLPPSWCAPVAAALARGALPRRPSKAAKEGFDPPSLEALAAFVASERAAGPVHPPDADVFAALHLTPYEEAAVVLIGQDPYHGPGQAHGLSFSVPRGVAAPPSLVNIFKELESDRGVARPAHGCLEAWARRGVLLLNTALTVREGEAGSHARPWAPFTDALIRALVAREAPLVFSLWGNHARKKAELVDRSRHRVVEGVHPSPLSASQGFFGSRPFAAIDAALRELGRPPIDWTIPP